MNQEEYFWYVQQEEATKKYEEIKNLPSPLSQGRRVA